MLLTRERWQDTASTDDVTVVGLGPGPASHVTQATLDAIAVVVAHARQPGEEPSDIGRLRFDGARAELGIALPSAQALAKRFRLPLAQLIRMAGKDTFLAAGGESFEHIPCLNEHPAFLAWLAKRCRELPVPVIGRVRDGWPQVSVEHIEGEDEGAEAGPEGGEEA